MLNYRRPVHCGVVESQIGRPLSWRAEDVVYAQERRSRRVSTLRYGNNGEARRCSAVIDWIISPARKRKCTMHLLCVGVCARVQLRSFSASESAENTSPRSHHAGTVQVGGRPTWRNRLQKCVQSIANEEQTGQDHIDSRGQSDWLKMRELKTRGKSSTDFSGVSWRWQVQISCQSAACLQHFDWKGDIKLQTTYSCIYSDQPW